MQNNKSHNETCKCPCHARHPGKDSCECKCHLGGQQQPHNHPDGKKKPCCGN